MYFVHLFFEILGIFLFLWLFLGFIVWLNTLSHELKSENPYAAAKFYETEIGETLVMSLFFGLIAFHEEFFGDNKAPIFEHGLVIPGPWIGRELARRQREFDEARARDSSGLHKMYV